MIAIGVGCRKACPADDILGIIAAALAELEHRTQKLQTFASDPMLYPLEKKAAAYRLGEYTQTADAQAAPISAHGLFTLADKRGEPGLEKAAAALGLPLVFLDKAVLQLVAGGARSCSTRIADLYGLPSVAETAALAGAGQGAMLLVPRRSCPTATCAIAGKPA